MDAYSSTARVSYTTAKEVPGAYNTLQGQSATRQLWHPGG